MRRVAFIGVDLQRDFLEPEGALPVEGASQVLAGAKRLITQARAREIPLLLIADTHGDDDPVFEAFPAHCVEGSPGADVAPQLEVGDAVHIGNTHEPALEVRGGQPVVIHTPSHRRSMHENLNAGAVLLAADVEELVVFGATTETGVNGTVGGLLARDLQVVLVSDCLGFWDGERASSHLAALAGRGCRFLTVDGVLERYA